MAASRHLSAAVLAGSCLVAALPSPGIADPGRIDRSTPLLSPIARFLGFEDPRPEPIRRGLAAFEDGRFEEAVQAVQPIVSGPEPAHAADDARFLQALALLALGRDGLASPLLHHIVGAPEPGPYYVPALLELAEIAERAGRDEDGAALWSRHADRPLRAADERSRRIARLFFDFGTLRAPVRGLTRDERRWLSKPEELEVVLEKRRERAGDRLAYRAGLVLQRLGRYRESLDALLFIGVTSPYWPYARYSIAQDLYALGEPHEAVRTLARLERYPALTLEENRLRGRARLLRAAILIESGNLEKGIAAAGSIRDDDPAAARAKLLIAEALVTAGKPSLAIVYDEEESGPGSDGAGPALVAARSLALGSAYATLGDLAAAERVVRGAATRVRGAQVGEGTMARAVERLADRARQLVRDRRGRERAHRMHLSKGMREILAHDGPWSLATMLRRIRAALGAGAHVRIARGTKVEPREAPAGDELWLAYLRSPRRPMIEDALRRLEEPASQAPGASEAVSRLRARAEEDLRAVVRERNSELDRLGLELEVALAETLGERAGRLVTAPGTR